MAVLYMTIMGGSRDDALVGVRTELASRAELHRSFDDAGVLRMRSVERIPVPARTVVRLDPDGYHAMLLGLQRDLTAGASFPFTLTFENAGDVRAEATIRRRRASDDGMGDDMAMPMGPPDR